MGMYTTQLKTICESIIMHTRIELLDGSKKYPTVDDLLNDPNYKFTYDYHLPDLSPYTLCYNDQVQDKIFRKNFDATNTSAERNLYPCFDDEYRKDLQGKILLHYYTREICEETFGLWKLRLIAKLNDIMPYYNKLYTETFEKYLGNDYNLFSNINLETTDNFDRKIERIVESVLDEKMSGKNTTNGNTNEKHSGKDKRNYHRDYTESPSGAAYTDKIPTSKVTKTSDTPQGSVANLTSGYLSKVVEETGDLTKREYDASKSISRHFKDESLSYEEDEHGHIIDTSNTESNDSQRNTVSSNNENETSNEKSKNNRLVVGKNSNQSYAKLIKEIRESIINVDKMVIDELEPLFFGLW